MDPSEAERERSDPLRLAVMDAAKVDREEVRKMVIWTSVGRVVRLCIVVVVVAVALAVGSLVMDIVGYIKGKRNERS